MSDNVELISFEKYTYWDNLKKIGTISSIRLTDVVDISPPLILHEQLDRFNELVGSKYNPFRLFGNLRDLFDSQEVIVSSFPSLETLAAFAGYIDEGLREKLKYHSDRFQLYRKATGRYNLISNLLLSTVYLGIGWAFVTEGLSITDSLVASVQDNIWITGIIYVCAYLLYILSLIISLSVIFILGSKIAALPSDKKYAESLSIWIAVCLIIDLQRNDPLGTKERRNRVLKRAHDLRHCLLLLSLNYIGRDDENRRWSKNHFRQMERYVHERERWIIAPMESTVDDLIRDFLWFSGILISGLYWQFTWGAGEEQIEKAEEKTSSKRLLDFLPRLFGYILPVAILSFLLLRPGILNVDLNTSVLSLVLLSWGLIGIDNLLNLGFTAQIVNLAKGVKELI
jgi:hypothetical protein